MASSDIPTEGGFFSSRRSSGISSLNAGQLRRAAGRGAAGAFR